MSEAPTAPAGQAPGAIALVQDGAARGMIVLRGDPADPGFCTAATDLTGVDFPGPGEARIKGGHGLLWMSPDEVLILVPPGETGAALARLGTALAGTHHLAADVSDARALFRVTGPAAREVLAKLTPADLSPAAFGPGRVRRTRLAQVAAAFWMTEDETGFELVCFRSVAGYVRDLLRNAARPGGAVGYF